MGMELLVGLLIFVGIHCVNLLAPAVRENAIARLGLWGWKSLYSLISLLGFYLLVVGYAEARLNPTWMWHAPLWTRHLAALLTLPAFILLVAAYIPGNRIKAKIGHPMFLAVKLWATAHLIANGGLHDIATFGLLLVWSIAGFAVSRRRDRMKGVTYSSVGFSRDAITVVLGLVFWAAFAMVLHKWLIGIAPFGSMV